MVAGQDNEAVAHVARRLVQSQAGELGRLCQHNLHKPLGIAMLVFYQSAEARWTSSLNAKHYMRSKGTIGSDPDGVNSEVNVSK